MPVFRSLRPDFSTADQRTSNCLCFECHRGKSGRRDLIPGNYASDASHPVQFAVQFAVTSLPVHFQLHLVPDPPAQGQKRVLRLTLRQPDDAPDRPP